MNDTILLTLNQGELRMSNVLRKCSLCPRNCSVDRYQELGYCQAPAKLRVSLVSLHMYEEPFISGKNGSGTIFFSNCNVKCIFCQNKKIRDGYGKEITIRRFSEILLEQQKNNAHNINLVTPTHYVPLIKKGIKKAKMNGLTIPIIYNTSSYENIETIKMMNQLVDIYLADLKYYDDQYGKKYSKVDHYFFYASKAIEEMYQQVGKPIMRGNLLQRGVVVRVLLLPGLVEDAKKIIQYLYKTYHNQIYISIMNQYTPIQQYKYKELNRVVSEEEYTELVNYAYDLGVRRAFIQEGGTQRESFIPNFNLENV